MDQLIKEKQILTDEELEKIEEYYIREYSDDKINLDIKGITVNFSYLCNFNCTYCYQKNFQHKTSTITIEDVDRMYVFLEEYFMTKGKEFYLESITLSGGETLLPSNIEVLNYFLNKFHDKASNITMFTNGVNIMKYFDIVDYSKITDFQISLDGVNDVIASVNQFNGDVFDDILLGIKTLKDMNKNIKVVTLLCEEVIMNLKELLDNNVVQEILTAENVEWVLSLILKMGSKTIVHEEFYKIDEMIKMRNKAIDIIGDKKMVVGSVDFGLLPSAINRKKNTKINHTIHRCNPHKGLSLLFGPDGDIFWCACIDQHKGKVGNYYIKNSIDISEIKKYFRRNTMQLTECKNCDFKYVCGGGCALSSLNDINEPYCGAFKDMECLHNLEKLI